ncbi:MAG: hemolysin family protein [Candidatus Omnitrophica bacterium]|nr:hemolysin family protein [Candidatus Omnitrophota bacterium]MDD5081714.1 hemolysin family protein [Candidatus Omnitrophota bacterium]MDD5441758.1 hemolysin family protein [Candidatus Omnitrophota bacterium]
MLSGVVIFIIFLVLSAFFSASETALFSLGTHRLRRIKERDRRAKTVDFLLKRPTQLLSTIVFGNMLVNIGLSSISTALFVSTFGPDGLIFSILVSGILILFFGEILPKTLAIYSSEKLSLLLAPVISWFMQAVNPIVLVIEKVVTFLSLHVASRVTHKDIGEEELKTAILLGFKDGQISRQEERMISKVLDFKDTWASEILTARVDVAAIDMKMGQDEVAGYLKEKCHSKFPVFENNIDNIIGVLYAKDVFFNQDRSYKELLREPIFIPESKRLDDLLKLFLEKKTRMAIVVDEYGGTQGIVTLEDVQEEIFGELYDEYEDKKELVEVVGKGQYRIYAKEAVKTVNMELGIKLPEDEDTLAGFILSRMEKIPKAGEKMVYEGGNEKITIVIERVTKRKIISVKVIV